MNPKLCNPFDKNCQPCPSWWMYKLSQSSSMPKSMIKGSKIKVMRPMTRSQTGLQVTATESKAAKHASSQSTGFVAGELKSESYLKAWMARPTLPKSILMVVLGDMLECGSCCVPEMFQLLCRVEDEVSIGGWGDASGVDEKLSHNDGLSMPWHCW